MNNRIKPASSKQVLRDAQLKHNLSFDGVDEDHLIALINYARHIGYDEGKEAMSQQLGRMLRSR